MADDIQPAQPAEKGVEIRDCAHCGATGTCNKGRTIDITHSCEWCVSQAGLKTNNPFPIVPCGYCKGKGYDVIDLKPQRQQQQRRGKWQK